MTAPISVTDLCKRFRRRHTHHPRTLKEAFVKRLRYMLSTEEFLALKDVDLTVERGEIVGAIGRNGAGKSTLLRLIGGVGLPDSGRIAVQGKIGALLELGAGFHPELTGRENVFVNGVISGLTRAEVASRFGDIVAFSELEQSIDNPLRTYSSGMQLRLAFSISVHTEPDILLIDEVLAVGDLAFQQKCLERIEYFRRQGCAIVIVSHDMGQIKNICDRIIWLKGGRIAASGDPKAVAEQYEQEMILETEKRRALLLGKQPDHAQAPPGQRVRRGTGEVEIIDVRLQDDDGNEISELRRGDALIVRVSCSSQKAVHSAIFSLTISNVDGRIFLDGNTSELDMPVLEKKGIARVRIDRPDLFSGQYFVDVGVYAKDWACIYDYHWHMHSLLVIEEGWDGNSRKQLTWELLPAEGQNVDGVT